MRNKLSNYDYFIRKAERLASEGNLKGSQKARKVAEGYRK